MLRLLTTDTANDARLRETLRTFLHFNSVKYRVLRPAERRGRTVTGDRLDVELALLICHWLGAAVLEPEPR